jgi:hypothetical protein
MLPLRRLHPVALVGLHGAKNTVLLLLLLTAVELSLDVSTDETSKKAHP